MKYPFLLGERIYLRGLNEEDLKGNYIQWLNDTEICKYNSHHIFPYYKENAEDYIKNTINDKYRLVLGIVLKENDFHIGNISLQSINYINRSAEFAILLGEKDFWGKGYSREASFLILQHGFMELNLNRIYCGTSAENIPLQKLALSLGMSEEGRRRQAMFKNGKYVDVIEYGILRDEYLNKLIE